MGYYGGKPNGSWLKRRPKACYVCMGMKCEHIRVEENILSTPGGMCKKYAGLGRIARNWPTPGRLREG